MKEKVIRSTTNYLMKYQNFSGSDLEKIRYGLEGLYLTLTKMVIIIGIAFFLGMLKEVIIILILFNIIRYTGFGFHANTSIECLILSTVNFILMPSLFLKFETSNITTIIIGTLCIISYVLFAPADTVKRPLPNKRKRIIRKILTVTIGLIYFGLIFIVPSWKPLFLSALVMQAIIINPLLYKVFRQPYNNYKNFKRP